MPSAIEVMQQAYARADPAHQEELFGSNTMALALIVASPAGDVLFRNDTVDDVLSLNHAEALTGPRTRLATGGMLHRAAAAAFANSRLHGATSILWRVAASDRGDWLILACCGEFEGETSAFLIVGRTEPPRARRGPGVTAAAVAGAVIVLCSPEEAPPRPPIPRSQGRARSTGISRSNAGGDPPRDSHGSIATSSGAPQAISVCFRETRPGVYRPDPRQSSSPLRVRRQREAHSTRPSRLSSRHTACMVLITSERLTWTRPV